MSPRTKSPKEPKAPKEPKKPKKSKPTEPETVDDRMTLTEHLAELRSRIIRSVLAVALGAVLIFIFYEPVLEFLKQPYDALCKDFTTMQFCMDGKGNFILTDPLAGFTARTRVAFWGGVVVALPVVLWQVWQFVVPGLHKKEKKYAAPFIISSVLLFLFGATIAYLLMAKSLEFLVKWAGPDFQVALTIDKYIRLLTLMMLAFGVGFLFPVLLVFLQLAGVLTPRTLLKYWRHATVAVIFMAALMTPSGDLFSLFGLATPMWIFFWASIAVGHLLTRKRRKEQAAAA